MGVARRATPSPARGGGSGRGRGPRAAALIGLAALVACGENHADPVALTAFSAAARDAICDWQVRCRHVPDRPTCDRLLDPKFYDTRRVTDAVAAGRLSYDPVAAGDCFEQTAAAHCFTQAFTQPRCADMFAGAVAEGGVCFASAECAGGADCLGRDSCAEQCCAGLCGPPIAPPEPPALADVGDACDTHFDCVPEAYCESDGRCAAAPEQEGARCLFGCAPGDLYCDIESLTCLRYAAAGAPCDPTGQSAPPCNEGWAYCDSVCVSLPEAGQPCNDTDQRCIPTSNCDPALGVCVARAAPGAPCTSADECDVTCEADVCAGYETCSP